MGKFNVGDVVVRKHALNNLFRYEIGDGPYIVTAVSSRGHWLQINGWDSNGKDKHPWCAINFELVQMDDPLPPAPESVRYYHRGYHSIHTDAYLDVHSGHFASGPRIRINDKDNRGITIDADTALQLAHDLRRMAMDIKRKEKQQ